MFTKEELQALIANTVKSEFEALKAVNRQVIDTPAPATAGLTVVPQGFSEDVEPGIRAARLAKVILAQKLHGLPALECAKRMYPKDKVLQANIEGMMTKALSEGTGSEGGFLVPPEFSSEIIELRRAAAVVRRAGARMVSMNSGTLSIPKVTTGASASYIGENSNIGKTQQAFGMIQMSAKKLAALVPISNDLIRDSSGSADALVRDDIVKALRGKEDQAFIRSTGAAGEPKGLLYQVSTDNQFASTGTTADYVGADLAKAEYLIEDADLTLVNPGWLFCPRTKKHLMALRDGNNNFIYRDDMRKGMLNGYPYFVTTTIPRTLGSGDESEIYFGDFSQLLIGENENLLMDVSSEAAYYDGSNVVSAFSLDQTVIRVIARHDLGLRHDKAFSIITGVHWGS